VESLEIGDRAIAAIIGCNFDLVIFQRVYGGKARTLIRALNAVGTITAFFIADLYETPAYRETDYVFTVSDELKRILVSRGLDEGRILVVPDAIETSPSLCKDYAAMPANGLIQIVWVGAAGHWSTLDGIRLLLANDVRFADYRLLTISNHPDADIRWDLATVWQEVLRSDIGIVPVDLHAAEARVKSNNRVTMFRALGIPVICSRIPAYENVIVHANTGFSADADEDWADHLLALRDPLLRQQVGLRGRHDLFRVYGIDTIGRGFLRSVRQIARRVP
jgi:hypothetical protein